MLSTTVQSAVRRQLLRSSPVGLRCVSTASSNESKELTWTEFFKLRKQERTINLASSVTTALLTSSVSWNFISQVEIDPTQMIFGFDPFMICIAGLVATGGVGYLLGPLLGSVAFKIKNRDILPQFAKKDKEFLTKIIANRVNPSFQSFSNPVPDYYGEKISDLKSYRNWLRDCNAYNRKAKEFL